MRRLTIVSVLTVALAAALSACATVSAVDHVGSECWPAGVPSVSSMPVHSVGQFPVRGEDGVTVMLSAVIYGVDGALVMTAWVDGRLVAVDPKVHDPASPVLYNDREYNAQNHVRASPTGLPCSWRTSAGAVTSRSGFGRGA